MLVFYTNNNFIIFINIIFFSSENVILNCYEVYRQILVKTLQNLEKDPTFLLKMLMNINTCVDKNIFNNRQLWQILSGKDFTKSI